jgi:DNA-binding MarR family transcriptional regulator
MNAKEIELLNGILTYLNSKFKSTSDRNFTTTEIMEQFQLGISIVNTALDKLMSDGEYVHIYLGDMGWFTDKGEYFIEVIGGYQATNNLNNEQLSQYYTLKFFYDNKGVHTQKELEDYFALKGIEIKYKNLDSLDKHRYVTRGLVEQNRKTLSVFEINDKGKRLFENLKHQKEKEDKSFPAYINVTHMPQVFNQDINKLSVLEAFIKYRKLAWVEFAEKGIFLNYDAGTERGKLLGNIVEDLENTGILKRLPPPIAWEINNMERAKEERDRLTARDMFPAMKKLKIFLASSSELKEDREQFEIFINRKNKQWIDKGIFLELDMWEDFIDAISRTRLQDEYNKAIEESDIFIMLFFTKVGKYTEEEFDKAFKNFKTTNKPLIYTYFKNAPILVADLNDDTVTLLQFQKKLKELEHFVILYKNIEALEHHFNNQLEKLIAKGSI